MDAIRLQTGQRIDKDGRGTPNLPSTTIAVVNQSIKAAFVRQDMMVATVFVNET